LHPYLTQSVAVALNRVRALQENVACPDTPADAAALAARPGGLGVTRAGAYEQALRNQDKKINLVVFDTERELHDALETDKLLAGLGGEIELRQLFALRTRRLVSSSSFAWWTSRRTRSPLPYGLTHPISQHGSMSFWTTWACS
jgi:ABC-type amino acid transport substrate-binding protein